MTEDWTYKLKYQERQQAHELKLAVIKLFQDDPTAKYWAAIAIGAGALWVENLVGGAGSRPVTTAPTEPPVGGEEPPPTTPSPLDGMTAEKFFNKSREEKAEFWARLNADQKAQMQAMNDIWITNPFNAMRLAAQGQTYIMEDTVKDLGVGLQGLNPFAWLNTLTKQLTAGWIGINTVALILTCVFGQSEKGHKLLGSVIEATGEAVPP